MATPLASPQSLVGLQSIQQIIGEDTKINFGTWFLSALPVTVVSLFVCYLFLFVFFKLDITEVPYSPEKMSFFYSVCKQYIFEIND
ncbi:MAG: hypothetical protein EZS28_055839 [Streblomastix strix]|uniref:Uncharacterized protein n=1 Tax=Streblomastix strix TaxID=222440 RepID=A0A5J4PTM0_9EUKA|nr:MAG: hypothetical protein EZS28_055839 [Streblomastix strix]